MAPGGIEPTTFALLARRSNQLSYGDAYTQLMSNDNIKRVNQINYRLVRHRKCRSFMMNEHAQVSDCGLSDVRISCVQVSDV